jgi:hypothetical protein
MSRLCHFNNLRYAMKTKLIPLFAALLAAPLVLHAQQSTLDEGDSYA